MSSNAMLQLGTVVAECTAHVDRVYSICHVGHFVWTGSADNVLMVWDPLVR